MSVPNRFTAVSAIPQEGINPYQFLLFSQVKENVELLTGLRGEVDAISKAVTQGQITVNSLPDQSMKQVTANGDGFTISSSDVAGLADFVRLITDVQNLANDVAETRSYLNAILKQLKGQTG